MKIAKISAVLSSPELSAAAAADGGVGRLAQVAVALNCALEEASTADAERQLHKLVWLLCARSGGDICGSADTLKAGCNKTHQCLCGKGEGGGSLV
ncbi:MAG: hypothetical protein K8R10_07355 [Rhodocyclales bacterium]|jgi:hypothetical protein|nr:hypothetical protein [Rhodocyclales bacterium]